VFAHAVKSEEKGKQTFFKGEKKMFRMRRRRGGRWGGLRTGEMEERHPCIRWGGDLENRSESGLLEDSYHLQTPRNKVAGKNRCLSRLLFGPVPQTEGCSRSESTGGETLTGNSRNMRLLGLSRFIELWAGEEGRKINRGRNEEDRNLRYEKPEWVDPLH